MILPPAALQVQLQALLDWWAAGTSPVRVDCYDGAPPATPGAGVAITPALSFALPRPLPTVTADGSVSLLPIEAALVVRTTELRWCRIVRGDGTWGGDDLVTPDTGDGLWRITGDAGPSGGVLVRAGGLIVPGAATLVG